MSTSDLWIAGVLLGVALGLQAGGCERSEPRAAQLAAPASVEATPQPGRREQVVLRVRDLGEIRIELLAQHAPATVENFKKLARAGFYDGTTFHRVVPGFMIQGGDPNSRDRDPRNDGRGGPGYFIPDEHNPIAHGPGVVSMANTGRPGSAGSQFFIVVGDAPHLDGNYTAFGLVVEGLDVAERVAAAPRDLYGRHGPVDRPLEDVVVESVRIEPPGSRIASAARAEEAS